MLEYANQTFSIGNLELNNRLIQAPLAGISCSSFRELFSFFTQPAYGVTEMISAQSIINYHNLKPRYLSRSIKENKWCIQLSGHDADTLQQATIIAESYKPDLIDLNCGCPKPKIRGKGNGSALMDEPIILGQVVAAMRKSTTLPLTVKIRVAGQTSDNSYLDAVKAIADNGADAIIVHGRHHSEDYDIDANYQQINKIVKSLTIPVIANGDVRDKSSMERCFEQTGAAGIMIARGGIGRPWLYQQLLDPKFNMPSVNEIIKLFRHHICQLALLEDSEHIALLQARRLLKWYFPYLTAADLTQYYQILNINELYDKLSLLPHTSLNEAEYG